MLQILPDMSPHLVPDVGFGHPEQFPRKPTPAQRVTITKCLQIEKPLRPLGSNFPSRFEQAS